VLLVLVARFHRGLFSGALNWRTSGSTGGGGVYGVCVAPPEARFPREALWFKDDLKSLGFDCGVMRGIALTKRVKRDSRRGVMSGRLTDEADELLGVSMKLLVIECSDETMVLTESRSC